MNETVEFSYWITDEHGDDEKRVIVRKHDEDGLNANTLCEAFVDFMEAAGFSTDNIYDYFNEEEKTPW